MKKNLAIIALTAGILLAVVFLTFHLHQTSKEKVLSQFNEHQLLIARQVAIQIESYFESRSEDIRYLSSLPYFRRRDGERMPSDVLTNFKRLRTIHVKEISVFDDKGTVVFSTTAGAAGKKHPASDFHPWARKKENRGSVLLATAKANGPPASGTGESPGLSRSAVFLVSPTYREPDAGRKAGPGGIFTGMVSLSVDLEEMLAKRALLSASTMKLHKLWIMDKDGTLLLQSEHPEMAMRNIRERDDTCNRCHVSFDYAEKMLTTAQGTVEYPMKEGIRKVAAFATMSFGNTSWIVVSNAPYDEVTGFVRKNLLESLGLIGIVVLALSLASFFMHRNYRQKVSAQQEAKHLREKQGLMEALRETRDYLENLFGYANAPIIVWDPASRITRFNRAFERLTGYAAGEVVGQELRMLFPEGSREESLSRIARTLSGEYWESVEIPILRKDGETRLALWNSANLRAEDGSTVIATIAQGQDITERKQAEETLRRQRDELDARSRILGAIFSTKDLNERLDLILDKVMEFLGVEFGCIYLVRGNAVVLRSWRGISDEFRAHALSFPADRPPGLIRGPAVIHERLGEGSLMPEFAKSGGVQSCASFPLNIPGHGGGEEVEWLGTLVVGSRRFEALSKFDVEALHAMAGQLALAIDHARSYRHAEGRLARLQTLRDIDRAIIQDIDLGQALHIVLERVPRELGADAAAISLLDETKLQMGVFSMRLPNGTFVEEEAFSLADSLLHWFVERQETIIIYDTMQDPRLQMNHRLFRDHRVFSYLGVPLIVQDKTVGVLHILTTHPKVFDAEDVEFFRTLAGQTAIAIENTRANEALRVSERKYRTLFEESKDVVYISTPEGRFIDINPAGVALFGYSSREELLAADIPRDLYVDPRDRERYRQAMSRDGYVKDFEVAMKRKDGEKLIVLSTATAEYDKNRSIVAYRGIMRDMTRFKQLEHQLAQSQKMEAIGRLSGGLAHDINNYLGAMTGYCELVKMTYEKDKELAKKMDVIVNTGFKASALLKQLLAFSRKQPMQPEVVDLNRVVEGMEKMLTRLIGEDIRLETHLRKDIPNTKVDPSQVEQVLVNLVVNARNAMPRGGEITIETTTVEFDKDYLLNRPVAKAGEYVMLAVSDTGIGIPEEIRDKIFEPFFTTDAGKGSGLGLSTVYGIVKQNEGYIWVYSEVGKGTTFKIYFPACREDIPASEQQDTPAVRKEGGSRKILFVEDNDSMREAFRTVLEGMGYYVIAASNGEVALKYFAEQGRDVDLLITDVILPGMNGRELMDRMKETKKDLKVLFISGYTSNVIASRGILHEDINFLQKPFSAADLAEKITEVLGE